MSSTKTMILIQVNGTVSPDQLLKSHLKSRVRVLYWEILPMSSPKTMILIQVNGTVSPDQLLKSHLKSLVRVLYWEIFHNNRKSSKVSEKESSAAPKGKTKPKRKNPPKGKKPYFVGKIN